MNTLKLYLTEEVENNLSDFRKSLINEDIEKLNKEFPLEENQFDFRVNYTIENDEDVEIEFYLRNNIDLDLNFDVMPMHLVHDECVIGIQMFDFKKMGRIPKKSIIPYTIKFNKKNIYYLEYLHEANLVLGINVEFKVESTAKTEIINLPEFLNKKDENFIKEKINQLPDLRIDTFDYGSIEIGSDKDGNVHAIVIIRNGYDHELKLNEMKFNINDPKGLPIYCGTFKAPCDKLEARKALLYKLKINKEELPIENVDYSKCTLKFV